jgi:hypothetical protein
VVMNVDFKIFHVDIDCNLQQVTHLDQRRGKEMR